MGHDHHFLSRLDRVHTQHTELALSLYRDDELISGGELRSPRKARSRRFCWLLRQVMAGSLTAPFVVACQTARVPLHHNTAPDWGPDAAVELVPDSAADEPAPVATQSAADAASEPAPTADAAACVPLPGPCVEPLHDAATRLHREKCFLVASHDYDADGEKDATVVCGAFDHHLIYVMRGTCGHFVGDIRHDCWLKKGPGMAHGLIDVDCEFDCICDGHPHDAVRFRYRFDGTELRESRQVTRGACNCLHVVDL